jgi:hypothetical protein
LTDSRRGSNLREVGFFHLRKSRILLLADKPHASGSRIARNCGWLDLRMELQAFREAQAQGSNIIGASRP